jgi:hypothetical protein
MTGTLNTVGSDHLVAPDIDLRSFSRAGDLRLSELGAVTVPAIPGFAFAFSVAAAVLVGLGHVAALRRRSG